MCTQFDELLATSLKASRELGLGLHFLPELSTYSVVEKVLFQSRRVLITNSTRNNKISDTLTLHRSTCRNPATEAMPASLERLLIASNLSELKIICVAGDTRSSHAPTDIHSPKPATTLHYTALQIEHGRKIAEAIAAPQSEAQNYMN